MEPAVPVIQQRRASRSHSPAQVIPDTMDDSALQGVNGPCGTKTHTVAAKIYICAFAVDFIRDPLLKGGQKTGVLWLHKCRNKEIHCTGCHLLKHLGNKETLWRVCWQFSPSFPSRLLKSKQMPTGGRRGEEMVTKSIEGNQTTANSMGVYWKICSKASCDATHLLFAFIKWKTKHHSDRQTREMRHSSKEAVVLPESACLLPHSNSMLYCQLLLPFYHSHKPQLGILNGNS